jgi:hypothetical protein
MIDCVFSILHNLLCRSPFLFWPAFVIAPILGIIGFRAAPTGLQLFLKDVNRIDGNLLFQVGVSIPLAEQGLAIFAYLQSLPPIEDGY